MARTMQPPRAFQRMLSGRRLDLLDPSPLDVEIEDIAHGLARVARWNGQTLGPHIYSVAQHSLFVEHILRIIDPGAPARWMMTALLHDAPEYVIGDMISPFKAVIGDQYKSVEERLMSAIHLRLGLPAVTPAPLRKIIKQADRIAAYAEAIHLAGFSIPEAEQFFGKPQHALRKIEPFIQPIESGRSQQLFLERFHTIEAQMNAAPKAASRK
ncbi:MAG: HD family hydrolase [Alphaproteobacteria bacterium]|nr:HD family hydrolase [Alphaproteobacteria bacterium]